MTENNSINLKIKKLNDSRNSLKEKDNRRSVYKVTKYTSNPAPIDLQDAVARLDSIQNEVAQVSDYLNNPKIHTKIWTESLPEILVKRYERPIQGFSGAHLTPYQVILSVIPTYFNDWLKDNGLEGMFSIVKRPGSSLPVFLVIDSNNTEICRFRLDSREFGIVADRRTVEDTLSENEASIKELDEEIEEHQERLELYKDAQKNFTKANIKSCKTKKDKLGAILFIPKYLLNKKKCQDKLVRFVDTYESEIKSFKKRQVDYQVNCDYYIANYDVINDSFEVLKTFFDSVDFKEVEINKSETKDREEWLY